MPEYFQYSIDCSSSDLKDSSAPNSPRTYSATAGGQDTEQTCAKILTAEYLRDIIISQLLKASGDDLRTRPVLLVPDTKSLPLEKIKDCCGSTECQGCFQTSLRCAARVWHPNDRNNQKRIFWKGLCHLCAQVDCGNTCPNGKFAQTFMTRDKVNHLMNLVMQCKDCEPGTFNTCIFSDTCRW